MGVPVFPPPTSENDRVLVRTVLGVVPDAQGKAFAGTTGEWPSGNLSAVLHTLLVDTKQSDKVCATETSLRARNALCLPWYHSACSGNFLGLGARELKSRNRN